MEVGNMSQATATTALIGVPPAGTPDTTLLGWFLALLAQDGGPPDIPLTVELVNAAFTPGQLTGYSAADFDGAVTLNAGELALTAFYDPLTSQIVINIPDPEGGWNWTVSGATNLPQTVYGFTLKTGTAVLASGMIDPVELNTVGQGLSLGTVQFIFPLQPLG